MHIHIGKRIIKTAITLFLALLIYVAFLGLDNLLNIDAGNLVTIGGDINIGKTSFICSIIEMDSIRCFMILSI